MKNSNCIFGASEPLSRYAFTLAEVLITLGIIGVVAALTMPVLMQDTADKELEASYAKAKNVLANGYRMMMVNNDVRSFAYLPFLRNCEGGSDKSCMQSAHSGVFNISKDTTGSLDVSSLPDKYTYTNDEGEQEDSPFSWDDVPYVFETTDGMTYGVLPDESMQSVSVFAELNGGKKPNLLYKDMFKFRVGAGGSIVDVTKELEDNAVCSVDDPAGCKDEASCLQMGVSRCSSKTNGHSVCSYGCYKWEGGKCGPNNYTHQSNIWDDYNGGSGDGKTMWESHYCR